MALSFICGSGGLNIESAAIKIRLAFPSDTHSIRRRTRRGQTEISRDAKVAAVGTKGLREGGNNFYEHLVVGLVVSQVLASLSR